MILKVSYGVLVQPECNLSATYVVDGLSFLRIKSAWRGHIKNTIFYFAKRNEELSLLRW